MKNEKPSSKYAAELQERYVAPKENSQADNEAPLDLKMTGGQFGNSLQDT